MASHKTREGWLQDAVRRLDKAFFKENGYELPASIRASCGWPRGSKDAIGQCFDKDASSDQTYEIFICPTQAEPVKVLATLLHELIHACVGIEEGHKGAFRKLAKEFGLAGKMTATYAEEGSELHRQLEVLAGRIGDYPHAAMRRKKGVKKGGGGWVRLQSPENEEYKVLVSPKQLDEHGLPHDPWGNQMEPVNA